MQGDIIVILDENRFNFRNKKGSFHRDIKPYILKDAGKKVSVSDTLFLIEIEDVTKIGSTNTMRMLEMLSDRYNYKCEITDEADEFYEWSEVPGRILVASHWNDEKKRRMLMQPVLMLIPKGL